MVTRDKGHDVFTQVRALSVEVKPYSCLITIEQLIEKRKVMTISKAMIMNMHHVRDK